MSNENEIDREAEENPSLKDIPGPADVLLVVPPLTGIILPAFGLHLLQSGCRHKGIDTRVLYSNLLYAKLIGTDLHASLSVDDTLLLGERIFAASAFVFPPGSIGGQMHQFLDPDWVPDHAWKIKPGTPLQQIPEPIVSFREWLATLDVDYLETLTANWVHHLARQIVKKGFRIVGCSNTYGGLVPPIALLNAVKTTNPKIITILGGALCEAEMAEGILSLNADIDYIFSGEGEISFPELAGQILAGHLPKEKIIYGQEVIDLDTLPLPDYKEYIEQRQCKNIFIFPFETSRGCSYGKCTFCALNGKRNSFRCKSPDVIIRDLKSLQERHDSNGTKIIAMTDNMMPGQYFETLIPRLSTELPSLKIVYEMKAHLTLEQVLSLKKAGIIFRPGIESLSPPLLRRMQKPYTVRGNIALLRYTRSAGIDLEWALLFGFPGDQIDDYQEMLDLFPLIRHLQPPSRMVPLILYRFSQYHRSPGAFDISALRPAGVFKDILPAHTDLEKIAYYLTGDFLSRTHENPEIISALWEECLAWQGAWAAYKTIPLDTLLPTLHVIRKGTNCFVLEDTRGLPGRQERLEIDRERANLLLVSRPLEAAPAEDLRWALNAGLGVVRESWFIPLATAEPTLILEFERDYKPSPPDYTPGNEKNNTL